MPEEKCIMPTNGNYWRRWWNERGRDVSSDYELDRGSTSWDKEMEQRSEEEFFDFVDPKPSEFVFDTGCGTGINLSRLNSKVRGIIGMDLSEEVIKRSMKRIEREKLSEAGVIVGSITDIGLNNNVFDKVICMGVLHYLNDEECEAGHNRESQ